MKRSVQYRLEQKVKHGELSEVTINSPEESITIRYFGDNIDRMKWKGDKKKREKYKGYMDEIT